jgi:hypothetical protein
MAQASSLGIRAPSAGSVGSGASAQRSSTCSAVPRRCRDATPTTIRSCSGFGMEHAQCSPELRARSRTQLLARHAAPAARRCSRSAIRQQAEARSSSCVPYRPTWRPSPAASAIASGIPRRDARDARDGRRGRASPRSQRRRSVDDDGGRVRLTAFRRLAESRATQLTLRCAVTRRMNGLASATESRPLLGGANQKRVQGSAGGSPATRASLVLLSVLGRLHVRGRPVTGDRSSLGSSSWVRLATTRSRAVSCRSPSRPSIDGEHVLIVRHRRSRLARLH